MSLRPFGYCDKISTFKVYHRSAGQQELLAKKRRNLRIGDQGGVKSQMNFNTSFWQSEGANLSP
jgi:hypothetical protein